MQLASDAELGRALGRAARDAARKRFSCSGMAAQIIEIYKEQIGAGRRQPS